MAANIYDWSLTAGSNATADSGINWSEGQLPSTVNDSARVMMERIREWITDQGALTASGTDTITVTANSAFSAYATGMVLSFKAANSNTGAATLNVNGVGAKAIRKVTSVEEALAAGDIADDGIYVVRYDAAANSAAGAWILTSPSLPTITAYAKTLLDDATAGDVLTTLGVSAFVQTILNDTDAATVRTTLGLVIGTDVQAYDADLAAIAALTSAADKVPYATGSGTWALADLTTAGRNLIDDADAAAQRTTLGLTTTATLTYAAAQSFTPTAAYATAGSSSFAYTEQSGTYWQIGDLIFFTYNINFTPTEGTASGALQLGGFPFAAAGNWTFAIGSISSNFASWGASNTSITAFLEDTQQYVLLRLSKAGATSTAMSVSDTTSGVAHTVRFSGFYLKSA
jgi:hypothetical protein